MYLCQVLEGKIVMVMDMECPKCKKIHTGFNKVGDGFFTNICSVCPGGIELREILGSNDQIIGLLKEILEQLTKLNKKISY